MTDEPKRALTGAERGKRWRERLSARSVPTDVQFDRELRIVVITHVADETMTLAKAVGLTRERLRRRFSGDGIDSVIAKYAGESPR
jgi:hypothetical protein